MTSRLPSALARASHHTAFHNRTPILRHTSCPQLPSCSQKQQIRTLFYLPTILSPALWRSLVPRFLRRPSSPSSTTSATPTQERRGYNPATYFIWLSLLIGSQAIQIMTLQTSHDKFTRDTDAKLSLLRDVVGRIRKGEDVDVAKELGTGDAVKEREWKDVIRELEAEDAVFSTKRKARKAQAAADAEGVSANNGKAA